jgi:short/branched chain acyl-CoA dehydrogenase
VGHQFADIYLQIEAARLLVYNAARMKEEGQNFVVEAAMAKMAASQVAKRASEKAIEWGGGVGLWVAFARAQRGTGLTIG